MAFDESRDVSVLFGGRAGSLYSNETWEWDGTTWQLRAAGGPMARSGHTLAYDSERERVLLFGGNSGSANLGDTWAWDGAAWTVDGSPMPSARTGHVMVYDTYQQRLVMFDGSDDATMLGDTWAGHSRPPVITQQPATVTTWVGHVAEFAVAVDSEPPMTVHWRRDGEFLENGAFISGATDVSLEVYPVDESLAGVYDAVVTDACGSTTTTGATLIICADELDGDVNRDSSANGNDIASFIEILMAPNVTDSDLCRCDFDLNGTVNPDDLAGFVAKLIGT